LPLHPGVCLGPYEIVSALGAGGMGEVYRARDSRLRRDVAVKVLPAAFSADADRLHRFEQEAHAAAAMNHPNILAVYDVGTDAGVPFIVSEVLEGETLRQRMNNGPIPARKLLDFALQIAHGLAARTNGESSTAISSRRTSSSPRTTESRFSTSDWQS
jgi:serine/threonine protein kinase